MTNLNGKDHQDIEKIEGVSVYGTLLRVQKTYTISKSSLAEKSKENNTNYVGLTFARYWIKLMQIQNFSIEERGKSHDWSH